MKKAGCILAVLTVMLALAGAYVVNYFTRRKMGMARYVIYKNQGWERDYPMGLLVHTAVTVIIAASCLVLLLYIVRRKKVVKAAVFMMAAAIALTALYAWYTLGNSTETIRAYYFVSLLLAFAAVIQNAAAGLCIILCRKKTDEE